MSLVDLIPETIAESSFEALEWQRLRELLAGFAHSQVSVDWLLAVMPSRDATWFGRQHGLVEEMRILLEQGVTPGFGGLFDPADLLSRARIPGSSLEPEEMRDLLLLIGSIAAWQGFLGHVPDNLGARIPGLMALLRLDAGRELETLARSLRSRLNPDGTLAPDASPGLKRVRREIDRQRRTIEESLHMALRRLSESGETQEDLITIRGERFVIPVKSEFKRRISGVLHGASSSGQTVYLEPLETIEQNNELVRLLEEEQAESRRVFEAMTRETGLYADTITHGSAVLALLDTLQARAAFAEEFDCVRPQFASPAEPLLALKEARHPLLEKRLRGLPADSSRAIGIVPLTLGLTDRQRQLIVSGPNTGGKTVVLKTVGLLSMMAQAGIPVPAREAVFPIFERFLADIGDAQSIEQNISTFSAHVGNIQHILGLANAFSLVLLDELGSATEPEEGAALAVAIAGQILESQAWCLISTHHTSLKVYAEQQPGALNAAVGFDEQALAPTYQLRVGVPGASAGINIAQRLGLSPAIVKNARSQLNAQSKDISHFLDRLHAQLNAVNSEREQLQRREQEIVREKLRLEHEGLQEWRAKVRDFERQMESLLKDFEYRVREAIAAVEDHAVQQKLTKDAGRRIARLRAEFREQFNAAVVAQHSGADKGDPNAQPHIVGRIAPGDTVRLKSLGKDARVLRQLDGDVFEVTVGPMKMRVERADIAERAKEAAPLNPIAAARQRGVSVSLAQPEMIQTEINVIGRSVEDAAAEVDRFLDRAFLAGAARIRIVHGVGTGALRKGLRALLKDHPHVAEVGDAPQAEGGAGATIVGLRR